MKSGDSDIKNFSISSDTEDTSTFLQSSINTNKCKLKTLRVAKGLTRSDLAREIGKTTEFICMIEHEKYYPILETRIKIAQVLGTDTSAIWREER